MKWISLINNISSTNVIYKSLDLNKTFIKVIYLNKINPSNYLSKFPFT